MCQENLEVLLHIFFKWKMVKYGKYRQNVPSYNFHISDNDILFLAKRRMEMNRLRELREDHDLYQKDIAKLIHIDQSNIVNMN